MQEYHVKVILEGGLGNQLFQYAAGVVLANSLQASLTLDSTLSYLVHDRVGLRGINLSVPMRSRSLRLPTSLSSVDGRWVKLTAGVRNRRNSKAITIRSLRLLEKMCSNPPTASNILLKGHFQSEELALSAIELNAFAGWKLRRPTTWFEQSLKLFNQAPLAAIHIRRGDYRAGTSWGLLSPAYYKSALALLSVNRNDPIWLFSDEPEFARFLVQKLELKRAYVAIPPLDSPAIESLLLMSKAHWLVAANSTFSWWSGLLSKGTVIFPKPMYQKQVHPLTLSNATNLDSEWEIE